MNRRQDQTCPARFCVPCGRARKGRLDAFMKTGLKLMLLFAVFAAVLLISLSDPLFHRLSPAAEKGRADLSAWDFSRDGPVRLNGGWECYDGLLTPRDFDGQAPRVSYYADLTAAGLKDRPGAAGLKTYRLVVETGAPGRALGLTVGNVKMSSRLYLDGELQNASGTPAPPDGGYQPRPLAYNIYFLSTGRPVELILQTANFDSPFPGLNYSILLGDQKDIEFRKSATIALELCGSVLCFFFGLYYFFLYALNKRDREPLFGMLEFFAFAVVFLFSGQNLIYVIFPQLPFPLFFRIGCLFLLGANLSIFFFVREKSKKILPDSLFRIVLLCSAAYVAALLFAPYSFCMLLSPFFDLAVCALLLWICGRLVWMLLKAPARSAYKRMLFFYLICTGCLFITLLNNILYNVNLVSIKGPGSIAFCVFALFSQLILGARFMSVYNGMLKMDRVKDEFILKTSYELKSPLNSIVNLSKSALLKDPADPDGAKEILQSTVLTRNIAQRLQNVVNSMLDLTLLQNDQLRLNLSPVDLKICAELVVESCEKLVKSKNIRISVDFPEPLTAEADESRVRQILLNLVMNSVKSMSQGTIRIFGRREDGRVGISVEDSGCGIPPERQEDVFKPYVSLNGEGIGLGLHLSRRLAELMGGTVCLEWSEPGWGSCFSLWLPASEKKPAPVSLPPREKRQFLPYAADEPDGPERAAKGTILVADDEIYSLQAAADILRRAGYRVITVLSGGEALRYAQNNRLDLIILDVMMPESSGITVCRKIREKRSLIELPILLSTVGSINYDLDFGLKAGANDFITKPFLEKELLARTKTLISLKAFMEQAVGSELAFLHAQIKPHFLYNTINTIISFCYTDPEKAAALLSNFSKYLRLTFDIDQKFMRVPLSRELEMVRAFVEIQQARFGGGIDIAYEIDPALLEEKIPSLCLQPLVENAIRHGLLRGREKGSIVVSAKKKGSTGVLTVRDTGVGMSAERLAQVRGAAPMSSGGIGLLNVRRRIEGWHGADFSIESGEGTGTAVTITFDTAEGGDPDESSHSGRRTAEPAADADPDGEKRRL